MAIQLIVMTVCGVIAAVIASHKGRSVAGWFFGGFFLGLIGVIIVACLANVKEQKAHREQTERERHRLREQLRQERLKNEAFRRYSAERLDTHDQVLGVDTRSRPAALPGGAEKPALSAGDRAEAPEAALHRLVRAQEPTVQPAAEASGSLWYYELSGDTVGPVSEQQVRELMRAGTIGPNTLLWTEGLGGWTLAARIGRFNPGGVS